MKTILSAFLIAATAALTAAAANAAEFELRVGHNGGIDHPYQKGFEAFKKIAEEKSGGRIEVQIFPSAQLGAEDKVNNMVRNGLVAAQATSAAAGLAPFVPDIDALNYPFLFKSMDHYYKVMDGDVGKDLAKEVEDKLDVKLLGWGFSGTRSVWNGKHPVTTPDDLKDLKLRIINSEVMINAFKGFGTEVTPMAFGEIYNALQQKVIDGAETDNVDLQVEKFYEVTKYVSLTNHLYLGAAYVFSKKVFDKLPPDLQQVVLEAGTEATKVERQAMAEQALSARKFLEEHGLVYNEVDHAKFEAGVADLYANISSPTVADMVKRIQAQ
ncbi:TRAP transporter substrate-binding protein [Mesorhizobium sp. M7D.F.Ca.US.004.01.2.1]|uniref:TRAP transporter substrate-binding protein n=1 Tax=Mesorhizobium sp. M7D.F.Ca.US.004.01.2.1 TaxID=2496738 RepID=UPI000FCA7E6A|nr:TRAP transporter substrate-binding protein [Mesorhizobium sp. M7D.F.Ca.US.004.01.2.1]RUX87911.1 TRAP transporter substrate-binding protein [Mesorhizobium sp. M7D.F.Ca.US.004.01.2.1]